MPPHHATAVDGAECAAGMEREMEMEMEMEMEREREREMEAARKTWGCHA